MPSYLRTGLIMAPILQLAGATVGWVATRHALLPSAGCSFQLDHQQLLRVGVHCCKDMPVSLHKGKRKSVSCSWGPRESLKAPLPSRMGPA